MIGEKMRALLAAFDEAIAEQVASDRPEKYANIARLSRTAGEVRALVVQSLDEAETLAGFEAESRAFGTLGGTLGGTPGAVPYLHVGPAQANPVDQMRELMMTMAPIVESVSRKYASDGVLNRALEIRELSQAADAVRGADSDLASALVTRVRLLLGVANRGDDVVHPEFLRGRDTGGDGGEEHEGVVVGIDPAGAGGPRDATRVGQG